MSKGAFRRVGKDTENRILPLYARLPDKAFAQTAVSARLLCHPVLFEEFSEELLAIPIPEERKEPLSFFLNRLKASLGEVVLSKSFDFRNLYEKQTISLFTLFSILEMLSSSYPFRVIGDKDPDGLRLSLPLLLLTLSRLLSLSSTEEKPSTVTGFWENGRFLLELTPGDPAIARRAEKDPVLEKIEAAGSFSIEKRETEEGCRFYYSFLMGWRTSPAFYQVGRIWIRPWFAAAYEAAKQL